jgi:transcriptional regulator with XRE-family HTH domain
MPPRLHSANLRGRREALGATTKQMATGLGIELRELLALEHGTVSGDRLSYYAAWLSRLEASAQGRRSEQIKRAIDGMRFN